MACLVLLSMGQEIKNVNTVQSVGKWVGKKRNEIVQNRQRNTVLDFIWSPDVGGLNQSDLLAVVVSVSGNQKRKYSSVSGEMVMRRIARKT